MKNNVTNQPYASQQSTLRLLIFGFLLLQIPFLAADDIPAPKQAKGSHSDVATKDGKIRDDELMDYICEQIKANGKGVKDVKIMVQSCYGGGLLDDIERVFGPDGACKGVPWIASSASEADKTAGGYADETVDENSDNAFIGSPWTDALAGDSPLNLDGERGPLRDGASGLVLDSFETAAANDYLGPNNPKKQFQQETPQWATGNGGDKIEWKAENTKHEAIVFAGKSTHKRHNNNIVNMREGLKTTWGDSGNVKDIQNGTKQQLLDAIKDAASRLDENTQFVLYIDDHGTASIDMDEKKGNISFTPIEDPVSWTFEMPNGWFNGFFGNYFAAGSERPTPTLDLMITDCEYCSAWNYFINGVPLPFPGEDGTGLASLPIPFWVMRPGINLLEIVPQMPAGMQSSDNSNPRNHLGTLTVSRMEITTGPVNEVPVFPLLVPGQSAAFYNPDRAGEGVFVELLEEGRVVVYVFSYTSNGPDQAWMVGAGRQVAEGIIIDEMFQPSGAKFGPEFNPDDVVYTDFGSLAFHPPACTPDAEAGSLFMYPPGLSNYPSVALGNYVQLTNIVDCETSTGSANSPWSGSWYDPTHNGEGIILQVLKDGSAVVQWFTYDSEGKQMWIQGTGTFDGNKLTVDNLFTTSGTGWGANFDPDDVTLNAWGVLEITFGSCDSAVLNYDSSAGFGAGTLNLQRLSTLMGIPCQE